MATEAPIYLSGDTQEKSPADRDFKVGMRLSVAFHVLLAAFILVKSLVFPGKPMLYIPALRVDLVGLPDLLKKDLHNIPKADESDHLTQALKEAQKQAQKVKSEATPQKTPDKAPVAKAEAPPAPDELLLHPKKTQQAQVEPKHRKEKLRSALDRIKALERINAEFDTVSEKRSAPVVKGNKISKGSSLSPDARESGEANYLDSLREHLQENWSLPAWLSRQTLSAQVQIFLDAHGRLHSFRFSRTSGNPQFDDAVKRTIQESQPFPTPPTEIVSSLLSNGILIGFPL